MPDEFSSPPDLTLDDRADTVTVDVALGTVERRQSTTAEDEPLEVTRTAAGI